MFLLLNAVVGMMLQGSPVCRLGSVSLFLRGTSTNTRAAFIVLLPIGYLLLASAALVPLIRTYRRIFYFVSVGSVAAVLILGIAGIQNGLLELLSIGLLGVCCGYIPREYLNHFVRQPLWLMAAYGAYLCALTWCAEVYLLQIVGVGLTLALIYMLGARGNEQNWLFQIMSTLGRHSLLGYVVQIVFLQAVRFLFQKVDGIDVSFLGLITGSMLTVLSVEVVNESRKRFQTIDRLYSIIFA
jgi:hypothetical protein